MGKRLQASGDFDLDEEKVISELTEIIKVKNPLDRDAFYYSITINDKRSFSVDTNKLKGKLKKIISILESQLKASDAH